MTTHFSLRDLLNKLINSDTLILRELIIKGTLYYGIVLADKTALVPFGDFYEIFNPDEYEIKQEETQC